MSINGYCHCISGCINTKSVSLSICFCSGVAYTVMKSSTADLNALNAALAVIKWKKLACFYQGLDHEHHSTYTIGGNMLLRRVASM
jgi:hypothetical protein